MERQPGQLYFVTGLKYDMFCISLTNLNVTNAYGLSEGHWTNTKDATSVLSMLLDSMQLLRETTTTMNATPLILHADNCSAQIKNRYTLWFLCWLVCMRYFETVELWFLVAGHIKNVCDGVFGHIKREYRRKSVPVPYDMNKLIEDSCDQARFGNSSSVRWKRWKIILEELFKIPGELKITQHQVFQFRASIPGNVFVKPVSY